MCWPRVGRSRCVGAGSRSLPRTRCACGRGLRRRWPRASGAAPARGAAQLGAQLGVGHHPLYLALVDGAGELAVVEDVGEVEDGACWRRHGDAVPARDVGRRQGADDVEADALAGLDASRRCDIHIPAAPRHAPQRRCRDVTQRRIGADRGNGGDEEGLLREVAVPDRVDAAVDGVEAADADAVLDGRR